MSSHRSKPRTAAGRWMVEAYGPAVAVVVRQIEAEAVAAPYPDESHAWGKCAVCGAYVSDPEAWEPCVRPERSGAAPNDPRRMFTYERRAAAEDEA